MASAQRIAQRDPRYQYAVHKQTPRPTYRTANTLYPGLKSRGAKWQCCGRRFPASRFPCSASLPTSAEAGSLSVAHPAPKLGALHWIAPFTLSAAAAVATATYGGLLAAGAGPWIRWLLLGAGPLLMHAVLPLLDALIGERRPQPLPPSAKPPPADNLAARLLPTLCILTHLSVHLYALATVASAPLEPSLLPLLVLSLTASGSSAIAAAHELVHSRHGLHLGAAAALLTTHWWYPYFRIHHQHHLHVCTPVDYTCAGKGQDIYSFILQYVACGYREAWQLAAAECEKAGKSRFSVHNSTLVACMAQAVLTATVYLIFGPAATAVHVGVSAVLVSFLAVMDYALHYGLTRPLLPASSSSSSSSARRFAPVTHFISWTSLYPIENALLFNVLYHGDHHMVASKNYGWLRPVPSAHTFPAPLNALALSAFVPPLWRAAMDERADRANRLNLQHMGLEEAAETAR